LKDIEGIFVKQGADFCTPLLEIQERLSNIKAFIFDWDGVFNSGRKGNNTTSNFTEGDAMGTNMLRFSFNLKNGFNPHMFIATGALNPSAIEFTNREHFNGMFTRVLNKVEILPILKEKYGLEPNECGFIFDDILDLSLASRVGLKFFVKKTSNPLLNKYILEHKLCDFMSGHDGDHNAVREICELVIGLNENFDETIGNRIDFSTTYTDYYSSRNKIEPAFFKKEEEGIAEFKP
jgi:3-deoxy-D-manno-octulosonate 8-phosphate phosphatase (KDO 8-P phosphatase)